RRSAATWFCLPGSSPAGRASKQGFPRSMFALRSIMTSPAPPQPVEPSEIARLADALPPVVLFGSSSWNYPGWRGLVYHRDYRGKGAPARMLEEYARFPLFRTVGIDSSFYAPPTEDVLRGWSEHLPSGFPCVSKVWQQLTVHHWTKAQDPARAGKLNPDFLS